MMIYNFLQSKGVFETIKNGAVIDIGSGDGSEGKPFEENGFVVTSIEKKNGIDAFEYDYPIEAFDIAIAKNSLPFMGTSQEYIIRKIYETLKKDGYFYGTVFGFKEPWAKEGIITAVDFPILKQYLTDLGFTIIWSAEEFGIGQKMNGEYKDWHILKFLVNK